MCTMLVHPFPRVREKIVEELWGLFEVGKGVDFGRVKSGDGEVEKIRHVVLG